MDIFQVPKITSKIGDKNCIIIFIEGNICSRKTTTLQKIEKEKAKFKKRGIKLHFLYELEPPKDVMTKFYNGEISALNIELIFQKLKINQLYEAKIATRINDERRKKQGLKPYFHIILSDRGIIGNYIFTMNNFISGNISFDDKLFLDEQFFTNKELYAPDFVVYLRTPAEQCYESCKLRGKESEKNISLEYLKGLERMHDIILHCGPKNNLIKPIVPDTLKSDKFKLTVDTFDYSGSIIFRLLTFANQQYFMQDKNGYIDESTKSNVILRDTEDKLSVSAKIVRGIGYKIDTDKVFELNFDENNGIYKPQLIDIIKKIINYKFT